MLSDQDDYTLCEVPDPKVRHRNRQQLQRQDHARTFRDARHELRMTLSQCAALLRVSVRTLRNWESGQVRIPYAAFKLMRVLRGGKYLGPHWKDFYVRGDRLVTPEGHEFHAGDLSWWSLCVRQAQMYRTLSRQQRQDRHRTTGESSDAGRQAGTEPPPLADVAASLLAQVRSAPLAARSRKGQQPDALIAGTAAGDPVVQHRDGWAKVADATQRAFDNERTSTSPCGGVGGVLA